MPVNSARDLRAILFKEYGGFADKRIKNLDNNALFIVDDRGPSDLDARKQLFLWFCQIFVEVPETKLVRVKFRGDLPTNHSVAEWLEEQGAEQTSFGIEFNITPVNRSSLNDLAQRIANIVKKPYPVRSYKYVAPRTAMSVERLSATLAKAWGE